MYNLSEEYYNELFENILGVLNEDNNELIDDILRNVIFEEITETDKLTPTEKLYKYKENVLCFLDEVSLKSIWKYGHKDIKDVGKDVGRLGSKFKGKTTKGLIDVKSKLKTIQRKTSSKIKKGLTVNIEAGPKTRKTVKDTTKAVKEINKSIGDLQSKLSRASSGLRSFFGSRKVKTGAKIAVTLFLSLIVKKLYGALKQYNQGTCAKLHGRENILCRIKGLEEYQKMIKRQKANCAKTNDPKACSEKLDKILDKIERQKMKLIKK